MSEIEKVALILGGWSTILIAIVSFIGSNIINRFKIQWEKNSQKQLSTLKGEIDQKNSAISQILANHSKSFFILSEKKSNCLSEFWNYIITHKELINHTEYLYSFLQDEELASLLTSTDSAIIKLRQKDLQKIINDYPQISAKVGETKYKIDRLRPFIGEKLYSLYYIYTLFSMRCTFLLIGGISGRKSEVWKNDNSLIRVLKDSLSENEVEQLLKQKFGSYIAVTSLLEAKIITAINYSLTGEEVIDNTYQQINKIESIIAKQMRETSS